MADAPPGADPLAPEAPLAYVFSPLVGTPLTTSAKFAVVAKSPLTGLLTDALASSHFAIAGKLTGYDAIVVTGARAALSVLLIDDKGARLEDATELSGLTAAQAGTRLRQQWGERLGRGWRVAAIGPAGERGVRYATISHDGRHAGRGGLGAVLGAKRLKAIAVRAAAKVAPADPDAVLAASARCDDLGLDTISAGGTIAWAMECAERGLIDAPWLRFGDGDALLRVLDQIGARDGLGDLLAEGSQRAARQVGAGSAAFAPHVKGMEMPGYEPRTLHAMALGLAVNARGADHNRSGAYEADLSGELDRLDGGEAALFEGIGSGAVSTTYGDVINADVAIVTGSNSTANHPVASTFFKQARRRGTTIIYVDPRADKMADHADIYCQLKPGTDVAFYNGVMHEIIRLDLVDHDYIARRTTNFEALAKTVRDYPPERAEQITGVPADLIRRVARTWGEGDAGVIFWGIADVILPASSYLEKDGTYTNTDRRVQLGHKALDSPGEARLDWQVVQDIANRVGLGWDYASPREIFDEMVSVIPEEATGLDAGTEVEVTIYR